MSAYMADREHIAYLMAAVLREDVWFGYYHAGNWHKINGDAYETAAAWGQMLWNENMKSVLYRYPDCRGSGDLPGVVGENYTLEVDDIKAAYRLPLDPVQVLKSCHCYDYQSCEHPEYKSSAAHALIRALEARYIVRIPGYEEAVWGAPEFAVV